MKTQRKNITEEIERMKSLFTEERLYGNLVEQDAGFGKTTKDQRKDIKKQNKIDGRISTQSQARKDKRKVNQARRTKESGERAQQVKELTNCRKGINNLIKNFLPANIKKRVTVDQYINMLGGQGEYDNVKKQFNKCMTNEKIKKDSHNYKFGDKTGLEALNEIINNGDETYLTLNLGIIPDKVINKGKKVIDKAKKVIDRNVESGINIKNAQGKTIGKIMDLGNNKYKLAGGKKQWFLTSTLDKINYIQIPFIKQTLKNSNATLTITPNSGKREKDRDSFEFTVS